MSVPEKEDLPTAFGHLARVRSRSARQQVVDMVGNVDRQTAALAVTSGVEPPNGARVAGTRHSPGPTPASPADDARPLTVAVVIGTGFDGEIGRAPETPGRDGASVPFAGARIGTLTRSPTSRSASGPHRAGSVSGTAFGNGSAFPDHSRKESPPCPPQPHPAPVCRSSTSR